MTYQFAMTERVALDLLTPIPPQIGIKITTECLDVARSSGEPLDPALEREYLDSIAKDRLRLAGLICEEYPCNNEHTMCKINPGEVVELA